MKDLNPQQSAFPVPMVPYNRPDEFTDVQSTGLTKREWLAGQALAGMKLTSVSDGYSGVGSTELEAVARTCVRYADAVLEELGK